MHCAVQAAPLHGPLQWRHNYILFGHVLFNILSYHYLSFLYFAMVAGKGAAKAPLLLAFPPGKHFRVPFLDVR